MITFKQYLQEKAVSDEPEYHDINLSKAVNFIKTKCRSSLWMFDKDEFIYRGVRDEPINEFAIVDTSKTMRKSENTSNYYTTILDNNPLCKDFPKRSRSFICSTVLGRAGSYASNMDEDSIFVVIPTDNAKIGIVGASDIFDIYIPLFKYKDNKQVKRDLSNINNAFKKMGIEESLEGFKEVDAILKDKNANGHDSWVAKIQSQFGRDVDYSNFLEDIWEAYSPEHTGFKHCTGKTFKPYYKQRTEVWVGGEVLMVNYTLLKKIKEELE
jgi:hypothetical protein